MNTENSVSPRAKLSLDVSQQCSAEPVGLTSSKDLLRVYPQVDNLISLLSRGREQSIQKSSSQNLCLCDSTAMACRLLQPCENLHLFWAPKWFKKPAVTRSGRNQQHNKMLQEVCSQNRSLVEIGCWGELWHFTKMHQYIFKCLSGQFAFTVTED